MTYSLKEMLESKELRKALAESSFIFTDNNGVFDLDFQEKSMRLNHRAAFDRLCELGGEELLSKLVAGGKTCLTDTKEKGLSPIQGTDRFFLKTNAGAPTAFASILFGIAGWAEMSDEFDADGVFCQDEAKEENDFPPIDLDAFLAEEDEANPTRTNVSLVQKDNKFSLYDEDEQLFISLDCPGVPGDVLSSMAVCKPLQAPEKREDQEGSGPIEGLGWIYQLEAKEDAPWGWISADCRFVSAPLFSWITVHCDGHDYFAEDMEIFAYDADDSALYHTRGDAALVRVLSNTTLKADEAFRLEQSPYHKWVLLMYSDSVGLLQNRDDLFQAYSVIHNNYVLTMKSVFTPVSQKYMCSEVSLAACMNHIEFVKDTSGWAALSDEGEEKLTAQLKPSEYTDIRFLCSRKEETEFGDILTPRYAVRRADCYWAVVEQEFNFPDHTIRQLTPFAFTDMQQLYPGSNCALVDQFGKKGIFNCDAGTYPVPCEYETIEDASGFGISFTVKKAGFIGQIDHKGKWLEHLHR